MADTERDALLAKQQIAAPAPPAMLLKIRAIEPGFAAMLWVVVARDNADAWL